MDSVVGIEIRAYGVPGIVVTVVHDGRVVLAKGYGMADRDARRPMSADGTVMRVGSVSRPVTALAALPVTGWRLYRARTPRAEMALHASVAAFALVFTWLMWTWNLLGFRFV